MSDHEHRPADHQTWLRLARLTDEEIGDIVELALYTLRDSARSHNAGIDLGLSNKRLRSLEAKLMAIQDPA